MLEFNIRNQEISRIDNFSPAEKSVEYLIAKFNFKTEDWNEAIKRAIFRNVKSKVEKDAMLEDDACIVPWEVLVGSGEIEVSVHGVGKETITTDVATFNLDRTLSGGSATQEPSPTVYEQILQEVKNTKDIAQSVRNDADNGKFSGIPGEKGEDGKSAYEYAQNGGFKGTEEEFMQLIATVSEERIGNVVERYLEGRGNGQDGFSPIAKVIETEYGAIIEITDKDGKTTATVRDGKDGYTPVKDVDYFTEADKREFVNSVVTALPKYSGEVVNV